VGEFLVLSGAFQAKTLYGILAATGVIWSACYLLWMYQRVFFGEIKHDVNRTLPDLSVREKVALWPTAVAALAMGIIPLVWLNPIEPSVRQVLAPLSQTVAQVIGR
jgi:NADH-quinone oxidoreductase subunit M